MATISTTSANGMSRRAFIKFYWHS